MRVGSSAPALLVLAFVTVLLLASEECYER